jgi:serine phosphatase RsbU (regulator of sigma subunit)
MTSSSAELEAAASSISHDQVLLVEDDDADALLVEEFLLEVGAPVVVRRARSLNQAKALLAGSACVLLDLGLPDSQGLNGLRQLLEVEPDAAVVVLTGDTNEYLGEQAVRAGAQDYLVKGEVAGHVLHRVIRYAMERRRAEDAQRQLQAAQIHAQENARLERGLLPSPLLGDSRLRVSARCLAGGQHMLLGGDFYDVVEVADGWVHALIGDVCGRGPAEAALGVCLRVAWRALVLAGRPADEILFTLSQLLGHERQDDTMFATLCMVSVPPERSVGWVRMAGHLPPLLVTHDGVRELPTLSSPPLGLSDVRDWLGTQVRLEGSWSILLYTDGLIEGRIGRGSERLGSEGLMDLIRDIQRQGPFPGNADSQRPTDDQLLDQVIDRVRQLNGKELDDDLAILALGFSSPDGQ